MKKQISLTERLAGMVVSAALMTVGLIFMVLGVTFLPIVGILIAVPVMFLSLHFLTPRVEIAPAIEEYATEVNREEAYSSRPVLRPRNVG